jgi:GT2 family glycosyltransferase
MANCYFLYFEDLEWICRAKRIGAIGYAHRSVVVHKGGTTTGTARSRKGLSPLTVCHEIRNRIRFVPDQNPAWLGSTIAKQFLHAGWFGAFGAFRNMTAAFHGLMAGIKGEVGRPGAAAALAKK